MIRSIEIENFRCFHKTRIEGFSQINLIGGQNNAGKTALLEAILFFFYSKNSVVNMVIPKYQNEHGVVFFSHLINNKKQTYRL